MESAISGHNVTDQPPQQLATPLESPGEKSPTNILLPSLSPTATSTPSSTTPDAKVAIRRLGVPEPSRPQSRTVRACAQCQKKKIKCDGAKPKCRFCARSGAACTYTKSKRESQQLQFQTFEQRISAYESLLEEIISQGTTQDNRRSIQDAINRRFQASPDFFSTLLAANSPLDQHLPLPRPGLSLRRMHQAWHADETRQALALVQQPPIRVTSIQHWTSLVDDDVASHLLSLYFTWENPTWQLVDQPQFVHDLERGRTRFCSSLLVHTLLFFGCSFSYNLTRITDRREEKVLGEKLYAAIQRLWQQDKDSVDLPTVQSSILIGLLCCTFGLDKIGTRYISRGAEISQQLEIHTEQSPYFFWDIDDDPATILNCQKLVSWAVFDIHALACQVYRKPPVLDRPPAVQLSQEEAAVLDEGAEWCPYPFQTPVMQPFVYTASWVRSELVAIVHDIACFALKFPASTLSSDDWDYGYTLHQRLLGWNAKLPWSVLPRHNTTPHIICLHLYYHATTVSLCEIFLQNQSSAPPQPHRFDPTPIKCQSLDTIGSLVLLFKHCHGWKSIPIVMLHYFCVAGIHAVSKLHPRDPKWGLVLESSVVGLWHMSLGWGRLCKAFLRTIDLVLKARIRGQGGGSEELPSLVPPKVEAIFKQMSGSGSFWTETDAAALSAGYIVHHVPGDLKHNQTGGGSGSSAFRARALQELLLDMEGLAISSDAAGE
ncbi:hypothetical protein BJY01DRAFT_224420 [Aspergillus pseudoustus]|uniref:Zn(2)-C6 fungal-type domain-containing protein n=1 Tax=Aspergillus pseudoustus TaxID=1810923 RepID=A0ABR4J520_9EURO